MSTMIQIRNVPTRVHRALKARAAMEGISMSEFILREVEKALERPSRQEVLQRIAEQGSTHLPHPAAETLHGERERR